MQDSSSAAEADAAGLKCLKKCLNRKSSFET